MLSRRTLLGRVVFVLSAVVATGAIPAASAVEPAPESLPEAVIDRPGASTSVSAYGGYSAWSRYDSARRRYRLVIRDPGGSIRLAPVPSRSVAFDVDLGPGSGGRPTAIYSRCRRERQRARDSSLEPTWDGAVGCRLFLLTLSGGGERRLTALGDRSAYLPSVWRNRIAFAAHPRRRGAVSDLFIFDRARGRQRRISGGPRSFASYSYSGPRALDLRGTELAYGWSYDGGGDDECPDESTGDGRLGALFSEVRVGAQGRSSSQRLARACLDDVPSFVNLAGWSGPRVYFGITDFSSGPTFRTILRSSRSDGSGALTIGGVGSSDSNLTSLAVDRQQLFMERREFMGPFERREPRDEIAQAQLP